MSTLLDASVVSELMRGSPDQSVARWVSGHPVEDLFLSAVSEAELRHGAAILPSGRRRAPLFFRIDTMLDDGFEDRVLLFDGDAARAYGCIAAGRPMASADGRIAAIAAASRMRLAARNVRDFEEMGVETVNPWAGSWEPGPERSPVSRSAPCGRDAVRGNAVT